MIRRVSDLQRRYSVAHHKATNGEFVILHQGLKTFDPVLAEPLFERLKSFGDISVRTVHQPIETHG